MKISIEAKSLKKLSGKLDRFPSQFSVRLDELVAEFGNELLAATRRHASQRPGPEAQSGAYVNAMELKLEKLYARVVNKSPQTHRLEHGFYGQDSLGRVYSQPAYPHFKPALEEVAPKFIKQAAKLPRKVWKEV